MKIEHPDLQIFGDLTVDGQSIVLLAQGPDHMVARATVAFEEATPLISKTKPAGGLVVAATWGAVVQLSSTFGRSWRPTAVLAEWIAARIVERGEQRGELYVPTPPGLVPRQYQIEAAAMIRAVGSVLLFDEPGTGKTVSAILGLVERAAAGHPVFPCVVVAPAAVVDTWVDHFHDWAPRWRTVAWRGSFARRRRLVGTADVYVCSYETARRDAGEMDEQEAPLMALHAAYVVADEVHRMKAQATVQSQAVRRLAGKAANFLGLSGTPITHNPGDVWPALHAMDNLAWPSRDRWITRYCHSVKKDYTVTALGLNAHREPEFRLTLLGQHRRVAKADVLDQLPPKVYTTRHVDLPEKWRKVYDDVEEKMLADLPEWGTELSVLSVLSQFSRLSQLASAPADVEIEHRMGNNPFTGEPEMRPHTKVTLKPESWKVTELLDIMDERPGKPIVTFAPSRQLMMLAGDAAKAKGYRVGYVVGDQTARVRTEYVNRFQAGELDLMCVTTQAGGVGLTLTAAGTAVFLQRPWSFVDASQSEDRLHRIGAERHESIEIIDVIARNTIESRIRSVLRERAGQLSDFVQDPRIVAEVLGGAGVRELKRRSA